MAGYNGWANFETWTVMNWINSEDMDRHARIIWDEVGQDEEEFCYEFTNWIREEYFQDMPVINGVYCDLLEQALGCVNWYAVSRFFLNRL